MFCNQRMGGFNEITLAKQTQTMKAKRHSGRKCMQRGRWSSNVELQEDITCYWEITDNGDIKSLVWLICL